MPMRRSTGKLLRESQQIDAVTFLERAFPDPMLFRMVHSAKAQRPSIRRFETLSAIGAAANMGTLDRK